MNIEIEPRYKKAAEEIPLIVDFRNELVKYPGEDLQAVGSSVELIDNVTGIDVTTDMLIGFAVSGTRLESKIKNGEVGKTYTVSFTGKTQTLKFIECVPLVIEASR